MSDDHPKYLEANPTTIAIVAVGIAIQFIFRLTSHTDLPPTYYILDLFVSAAICCVGVARFWRRETSWRLTMVDAQVFFIMLCGLILWGLFLMATKLIPFRNASTINEAYLSLFYHPLAFLADIGALLLSFGICLAIGRLITRISGGSKGR